MASSTVDVPSLRIEDRVFSSVLLGHNPFLGYSYYSEARAREYAARFTAPEPVQEVICAALEQGVRGMMTSLAEAERAAHIVQAIEKTVEQTGIALPTIAIVTPDFEQHISTMRRINCQAALVHGQVTDAMFVKAEGAFKPEFGDLLARLRKSGFVPGMSTHNAGETIPAARDQDVAFVNTPVNKLGWYMCPCEERALTTIRDTSKSIIAMKTLAMGRIAPKEALDYVASVEGVAAMVLGIATAAEAEETFGLAHAAFASRSARGAATARKETGQACGH